jgi:glucose-1-phosphate thymidylyltransferase
MVMFFEIVKKRQAYKIACLEKVAFNQSWLSKEAIVQLAKPLQKNSYG